MINVIKKCLNLTFFVLFVAVLQINNVSANPIYFDIVVDSSGRAVRTTDGDCVRTKWTTDKNLCCCNCVTSFPIESNDESDDDNEGKISKVAIPYNGHVYFDFAKANIKDSEKQKLDEMAKVLKEHEIEHLHIYGFTDRIGSARYNTTLSEKRALAVFDYLKARAEKLKSYTSEVDMKGFGKDKQIKECKNLPTKKATIECLAPNRRVEVSVEYLDTIR